jgi:hypothetical protein
MTTPLPVLPVLVVSCDRYSDLWRPFFEIFFRRWPARRGPLYLGTNFASYDDPRVQTLAVGTDVTWAAGVLRMLDRIPGDYVLVMLEDFLLMEDVDNTRIETLAALAAKQSVGCLRLYSIYPPEHHLPDHRGLGVFLPGDKWRITAQAAIWRIETLRKLLVPGFSAWDFEMIGSQMSDFLGDAIWGVMRPALVYDHAVEKGKWRPQGLAICREAGVEVDLQRRPAFSATELAQHEAAGVIDSRFAEQKTDAVWEFRRARRGAGARILLRCLRERPWSLQLWAIAAAGLAGPRAVEELQRMHVRAKVSAARRLYDRALRRETQRAG